MCLSRAAFVELKVGTRLIDAGVKPSRAWGVARKVRRRYEAKAVERTHDTNRVACADNPDDGV